MVAAEMHDALAIENAENAFMRPLDRWTHAQKSELRNVSDQKCVRRHLLSAALRAVPRKGQNGVKISKI